MKKSIVMFTLILISTCIEEGKHRGSWNSHLFDSLYFIKTIPGSKGIE